MNLRETVDKYLEIAGDFGRAVPLADFGSEPIAEVLV